jgi:hypothetical protein
MDDSVLPQLLATLTRLEEALEGQSKVRASEERGLCVEPAHSDPALQRLADDTAALASAKETQRQLRKAKTEHVLAEASTREKLATLHQRLQLARAALEASNEEGSDEAIRLSFARFQAALAAERALTREVASLSAATQKEMDEHEADVERVRLAPRRQQVAQAQDGLAAAVEAAAAAKTAFEDRVDGLGVEKAEREAVISAASAEEQRQRQEVRRATAANDAALRKAATLRCAPARSSVPPETA